MKNSPTDTSLQEFYEEQLDAQRGMLSSAIEELRIKNNELEKTLSRLTQRNSEISQISYRTYHEMRGPMVTLLGVLELVRSEVKNETVNSLLDQAVILINRLDQFSNSLSNYTKIIQSEFFAEKINLKLLFEEVKKELTFQEGFEKVNLNFELQEEGKATKFYFDKLRLRTLFRVLISNAIRYRDIDKQNSLCKIDVLVKSNSINVKISDNGMGIAKEAMPRIFSMFYRGSEISQGSGLGLYVANNIVTEANGNIQLDSEEGIGTTVILYLPSV